MSSTAKDVVLSLKVVINKEKTKVLFAEADSEFVDALLSFLTLPLGRIVKLLEKHYEDKSPVFGSITSLYRGLSNLDDIYFSTSAAKLMLLDPRSSFDSKCKLKLDISEAPPTKYFMCDSGLSCIYKKCGNVCLYYGGFANCDCGKPLDDEIDITSSEDVGGFTINTASLVISDDLRMVPYTTGFIQALSKLGITGVDGAELRNLTLGTHEIMDLLKCCLLSNTPLTDSILNNGEIISSAAKPAPGYFLHQFQKEAETSNSEEIILKVMVRKSTNTLLFAQAGDDFIELLSSFLIIPVGGVESLLDTNTCLKSLDNLHGSLSDVIVDKFFINVDTKKSLMNPKLPHLFISRNMFLPLVEQSAPAFQFIECNTKITSFKSPKGNKSYIKESTAYMVTDDLTVTPFCISSSLSILNRLNIPLSDVDELGMRIGLQECLSILKASLTSKSALTNGLINRIMKKQPKQEH